MKVDENNDNEVNDNRENEDNNNKDNNNEDYSRYECRGPNCDVRAVLQFCDVFLVQV